MNRADYDLLKRALIHERRDAEVTGNRRDIQRVEHAVPTIAEALASENRTFLPVAWIFDACGVRSVSQLTAPTRREIEARFGTPQGERRRSSRGTGANRPTAWLTLSRPGSA
jgi:hypothetical protein